MGQQERILKILHDDDAFYEGFSVGRSLVKFGGFHTPQETEETIWKGSFSTIKQNPLYYQGVLQGLGGASVDFGKYIISKE